MMGPETALLLGILLLVGNAFFVGAEFSMVSVRRSAIEPLAAKGSKRAVVTLGALENLAFLLAGAQLGITLCSLALGAVAEPAFAYMLDQPLQDLNISHDWLHPISFAIALIVTVFLHVVIGEMVPKNIALATPERSALLLTPMLVWVVRIMNPAVQFLNALANITLKLAGVRTRNEVSSTYTRDEVASLVRESRREGLLSEDDESLLSGALTFDARTVRSVVVPLDQLVMVDKAATYSSIEALSNQTGFSRFPVTGKKKRLLGYVHIKDVIKAEAGRRGEKLQTRDIRRMANVNANQSTRMTLKIMQRSGAHMALVNSGKKTIGLVTMEDVLEELVGEMHQTEDTQRQTNNT